MASDLIDTLKSMGQLPKVLILRMRLVPYLDATGERVLESIIKQCNDHGAQIIVSGLQTQPMRMLKNAHIEQGKTTAIFAVDYTEALKKAESIVCGDM